MELVIIILGGGPKQCQPPLADGQGGRMSGTVVATRAHRNIGVHDRMPAQARFLTAAHCRVTIVTRKNAAHSMRGVDARSHAGTTNAQLVRTRA